MELNTLRAGTFKSRVLVLEDDDFTRTMLSENLRSTGFIVESAANVSQALDLLLQFEPNAVLVDLNLGSGPNGSDFLIRVDRDFPWIGQLHSHHTPHQS